MGYSDSKFQFTHSELHALPLWFGEANSQLRNDILVWLGCPAMKMWDGIKEDAKAHYYVNDNLPPSENSWGYKYITSYGYLIAARWTGTSLDIYRAYDPNWRE